MNYRLLHVGFGNMVVAERVIAIVSPASAPIRRLREEARAAGLLVDASQGRKTRSILVMDSGHVVISAIQPETISARFGDHDEKGEKLEKGGEADDDE